MSTTTPLKEAYGTAFADAELELAIAYRNLLRHLHDCGEGENELLHKCARTLLIASSPGKLIEARVADAKREEEAKGDD